MTAWLRGVEGDVLRTLAQAAAVFCLLDYDGTLAPLAPTPEAACPPPGTAALLGALAAAPDTDVALISGRTIAALRHWLDVPGLYYVGVHGLEIQLPNGAMRYQADVAAVEAALPSIRARLDAAVVNLPGVRIEDKGAALAVHYRLAAPAAGAAARQLVERIVREQRAAAVPLTVLHGHQVAELRPHGINKGKAVRQLLAAHAAHALPLYIGDDRTDEEAFAALPPPALTIRVDATGEPTNAAYRVPGPDDVHRFLQAVLDGRRRRLTERGDAGSGT